MTTNFSFQGLEKAGWNRLLIDQLEAANCTGFELTPQKASNAESRRSALFKFREVALLCNERNKFWVLSAHSAPQPNNRITQYKRFWNSMGLQHIAPDTKEVYDWPVHCADGLRFFGLASQDTVKDIDFLRLTEMEGATTWLLAIDGSLGGQHLCEVLKQGWGAFVNKLDENLIALLSTENGILARLIGEEKNCHAGVVAFCSARDSIQWKSLIELVGD